MADTPHGTAAEQAVADQITTARAVRRLTRDRDTAGPDHRTFAIQLGHPRTEQAVVVVVDGMDLTDYLSGLSIVASADGLPRITLEVAPGALAAILAVPAGRLRDTAAGSLQCGRRRHGGGISASPVGRADTPAVAGGGAYACAAAAVGAPRS